MCDMQTEKPSLTRQFLEWVRSYCPLWRACAAPVQEEKYVRICDISGPWKDLSRRPLCEKGWRYITDEYPEHEVVDVHLTDWAVHIYIQRKDGAFIDEVAPVING